MERPNYTHKEQINSSNSMTFYMSKIHIQLWLQDKEQFNCDWTIS